MANVTVCLSLPVSFCDLYVCVALAPSTQVQQRVNALKKMNPIGWCIIQCIFIIDHEEFSVCSEKIHSYQVK